MPVTTVGFNAATRVAVGAACLAVLVLSVGPAAAAVDGDRVVEPRRPAVTLDPTTRGGVAAPAQKATPPPQPSPDVEPPADLDDPGPDAVREPSGLVWKRLEPGTGSTRPGRNDAVTVDYVVWTADGRMIDRSRAGAPQRLELHRSIQGFSEALGLMVVGERRRFWIPQELAYDGRPGFPDGPLVLEATLRGIEPGPRPPADLAAPPDGAVTTPSGLRFVVLEPGDGSPPPGSRDAASVRFMTWRPDGRLLYRTPGSEGERIVLDETLPGLAEALVTMSPGERRRLWMSEELATLEGGTKPPGGPVVIDLELLGSQRRYERPASFTGPAADAVVSITGVASRVEEVGQGTRRPRYGDTVMLEFAGFTRDGVEFDSSFAHGRPGRFTLDEKLPLGLNEVLMQMVEGERRIVWIPGPLAYDGIEGRPQGLLVFNVSLVEIVDE